MHKVRLETKQQYFDYCKENEIINAPRKYGSSWATISDGIERNTYFESGNYISVEPKSYPCIFVWYCDTDCVDGTFIYPNELK